MISNAHPERRQPWRRAPGDPAALAGLARRVLGDRTAELAWRVGDGDMRSGFDATCADGRLQVTAADTVTAAYGLHRYITDIAKRRVCWDTSLPLGVPRLPDGAARGALPSEVTYYLNFCTFGYTAAAWDWERWQREIDWMALHGLTMPLASVGHEAVLAHVYGEAGLTDDEIVDFLGGPAYLPWQFMGCLDHWGARLDRRWLDERLELGRRIVARQLEYGMTPVLPAFVGHVPPQLAGKGTTTREWWGFTTHLLDPLDARFRELTAATVRTQIDLLGTAHLYAADPFIEMEPPDDDPTFLADVAGSLVNGLRNGDPEAVWVMQAWTFDYLAWWTDERVAHFLDSIPDDAMLVLDLWGEHSAQWRRFDGFRGKPWIWCALHDFGGRNDAFGAAEQTLIELHAANEAAEPPIGIGLSMEATEQNHLLYELVLDQPSVDEIDDWVGAFAVQRPGLDDHRLTRAWQRLASTVYATPHARLEPTERPSAITLRPSSSTLELAAIERFASERATYPLDTLIGACADLRDVLAEVVAADGAVMRHDLAAALSTLAGRACDALLVQLVRAWHAPGRPVAAPATELLALLDRLDDVLAHCPQLCLHTWEDAHAALGHTDGQRAMLRRDARLIVSVWNHVETSPLTDYSARVWSGLVGGLYRERWRVWIDALGEGDSVIDQRLGAVTSDFVDRGWPPPSPSSSITDAADWLLVACTEALDFPPPEHEHGLMTMPTTHPTSPTRGGKEARP